MIAICVVLAIWAFVATFVALALWWGLGVQRASLNWAENRCRKLRERCDALELELRS